MIHETQQVFKACTFAMNFGPCGAKYCELGLFPKSVTMIQNSDHSKSFKAVGGELLIQETGH